MATKFPIAIRTYNFSDGALEQLTDFIKASILQDLAELAARGITTATTDNLQDLRDAFADTPTDEEARGQVTDAVEIKDAAREAALDEARRLRTAAINKFGTGTGKYNRFGFEGMDELSDNNLPRALRRMHRVGTALQALLASEGIDAAFLTTFSAATQTFDDEIENVRMAEESRDEQTEDRINKGNTLYAEDVRLCAIGKDVFDGVSESKYNNYVIENFVGTDTSLANQYDLATFNIPASGSVIIAIGGGGSTSPDLDVYFRAVNGSVIVCTTDIPASPCTTGYELLQGITFAGAISGMNIDLTKQNLQVTNPGLTDVTVRAGVKIEQPGGGG